tara:strand:- start:30932 stop:31993 length:1062 start_codon:yes stop_codon:yes gene_type:complete
MAHLLRKLKINRVDLVDKGSNPGAHVRLFKRDEPIRKESTTFDEAIMGRRLHKIYAALGDQWGALIETLDSIRQSDDANKGAAIKGALNDFLGSVKQAIPSMLGALDDDMDKAGRKISASRMMRLRNLQKVLDDLIKEGEVMGEPTKKADEKVAKTPDASALRKMGNSFAAMFGRATGADETAIAELEKGDADPWKDVPGEVRARLEKAEAARVDEMKKAEALQKQVDDLREEQALRAFTEEVAGYQEIGLDPSKDAALLKSVTENLSEDHAKRIREIFKAAVAQAAASKLYGEVGSAGAGNLPGSVAEEVEQRIDAVIAKNDKIDREAARDRVFAVDQSLYERWRNETTVKV